MKSKERLNKNENDASHLTKTEKKTFFEEYSLWILVIFSLLLYSNTIGFEYVLDDGIVTTKNRFVQAGWAGIYDIFTHGYLYGFNGMNNQSYRPIALATMAIEKAIFGNSPIISHFFNTLFFAFGVGLLFTFFTKIFQQKNKYLPFVAALLFAAHPIHTEVVANIKSRDELLAFCFMLLSDAVCLF